MRTSITLFGKRWNMAPRRNRRRLVCLIFGVYACLLCWAWHDGTGVRAGLLFSGIYPIYASQILGGSSSRSVSIFGEAGVVESFDGRRGLKYPKKTNHSWWSSLFHPVVDDDPNLHHDERTAQRHARAHSSAFDFLNFVIVVGFTFQYFAADAPQTHSFMSLIPPKAADIAARLALEIAYMFVFTLPASILLWTEPDMEAEP